MDSAFIGVSARFESLECLVIECSLAAVSLGRTDVEKITTEEPRQENGRYVFELQKNPMCDYMVQFMQVQPSPSLSLLLSSFLCILSSCTWHVSVWCSC